MAKTPLDFDKVEVVELDLTTMCNAACPLCFRNHKDFPEKFKTPFARNVADILNQLLNFKNLKRVELIGQLSEPTTHPSFMTIARELKRLRKQIKICTNGDLYNEDFWTFLGQTLDDCDEVWFTLCGSSEEMHAKYRVGTSLKKILANAAALRRARKIDGARALKFQYNKEDLSSEGFASILSEFSRVEWISSCIPDPSIQFKQEFQLQDFYPPQEILNQYKQLDAFSRITTSEIDCQSIDEHQVQIGPFGDIYPCYLFFESNSSQKWTCDYTGILNHQHECCRFCQRRVSELKNKLKLNSII